MIKRIALIALSASVLFVGCGSEVIENYYPNSDKNKSPVLWAFLWEKYLFIDKIKTPV